MTTKTLDCNPANLGIFETQCASKHKIKISSEMGSDGINKIKVELKATDTSGAFTSSFSKGGTGHSVKIDIRYTPPASDGGTSRNIVTGETLAYVPLSGSYAEQVFDAIQPGTYNVTVKSQAGGPDCCKPTGSVTKTIRVEEVAATSVAPIQPMGGGNYAPTPSPNPVIVGMLAVMGIVAIGISMMSGDDE